MPDRRKRNLRCGLSACPLLPRHLRASQRLRRIGCLSCGRGREYCRRPRRRFYETSDKAHLEDAILLFYHHARFAAEELTGTDYTLVIPSVTYLEKKTGLFHTETTPVEIQGPFEIPIRLP